MKLSSVATDVLGVSGRADARGVDLRHSRSRGAGRTGQGKLRTKIPELKQALAGSFSAHHAMMLGHILAHMDYLEEAIDALTGGDRGADRPFRGQG